MQTKIQKAAIDKSKVQSVLQKFVNDDLISQDYADKVMAIVNKHTDTSSKDGNVSIDYYNPSTGAEIYVLPALPPLHGQLMFNKEGWNIIKEIITIGGGATTIGFAIAALCGAPVAAPIAALIGGVIVVANASVNLQFALGQEYAILIY